MALLSDIDVRVLDKLEESRSAPKFWNLREEIDADIVEGLNEAMLITAEPEIRAGQVIALAQNTNKQQLPTGCIALVRVEAPTAIQKIKVWELDNLNPRWQNDRDVDVFGVAGKIMYWFPIGLTMFGTYPRLTAPLDATTTFVGLPMLNTTAVPYVIQQPPYTGNEPLAFQDEYLGALVEYATHTSRLKEGGQEFIDSFDNYGKFLAVMESLSAFADRKGSLRFSKTIGVAAKVSEREQQ